MKQRLFSLTAVLSILYLLMITGAWATEADDIITQVEDNLNGETAIMTITMQVSTLRNQRTMKMESYSIGQEKSFIKMLYPGKDKGITFLKINNTMWQYVPRIEKTIKIPSSMMLQSWMGSDFTNDDLVKESSLSKDYIPKLLDKSETGFKLSLLPKEDAAVVWGKIEMEISKEYYLPTLVQYFDEEGVLIRELLYSEVKPFGKRFYPTKWLMTPKEPSKKGHVTQMLISNAVFDSKVDEAYFTKRALKKFSR